MIRSASAGCFLISARNGARAICRNSVGATVMTVAERGASSSSAISPSMAGGSSMLMMVFLAIVAEEDHLDPSLDDDQEVVARIALLKDDAAFGKLQRAGHAGHELQIGGVELVEERDGAKDFGG